METVAIDSSSQNETGTAAKLLIIEKEDEIGKLLKSRLSTEVSLDSLPVADTIPEELREKTYDILIWAGESSSTASSEI